MIVPMRHVTVFARARHRRSMLAQMRVFGALHLSEYRETPDVSPLIERRYHICRRALDILTNYRYTTAGAGRRHRDADYSHRIGEKLAEKIVHIDAALDERKQKLFNIRQQIALLKPWGRFDMRNIYALRDMDIHVRFYALTKKELHHSNIDNYFCVGRRGRQMYIVVVDYGALQEISYTEERLPESDLASLERVKLRYEIEITELREKLAAVAKQHAHIFRAWRRIVELNHITTARNAVRWAGDIIYISGFVPYTALRALRVLIKKMRWGITVREPRSDEPTPSLIRSNPIFAMAHPLYRLLGTLPGYHEPDISAVFLIFFVLFFSIIIGDAGYAALMIVTAGILFMRLMRVTRHVDRSMHTLQGARLLLTVGIATFIWGALSGNWFGYAPFADAPILSALVVPHIAAFNPQSIPFVQWLCFIIAAVHLTIAHSWRIALSIRARQYLAVLAEIGWIAVIISLYSLVVELILGLYGYWYPPHFSIVLIVGCGMVILFNKQQSGVSIIKGVMRGLSNIFGTLLDFISAFADTISYLRLFAVGLASVEIARSFNNIALSLADSAWGIVAALCLIGVGHTLNLLLGALSLIVHGIRLNMLEFSSHIGVQWAGITYKPFQREFIAYDTEVT